MKNIIIKELYEGVRSHRFLIIAIGMLFFAFLDPMLLKIMPKLLESQLNSLDLSAIFNINQPEAALNYLKSLYQIGSLVVCFALMNLIAGEFKSKTTIIPWGCGLSFSQWVSGKFAVYSIYLIVLAIISTTVNYYYAASLFEGRRFLLTAAVKSGFLYGLFFSLLVACLIFIGSLVKKANLTALITVAIAYLLPSLSSLFKISPYTPGGLLTEARLLVPYFTTEGSTALVCTICAILVLVILSVSRMKSVELY